LLLSLCSVRTLTPCFVLHTLMQAALRLSSTSHLTSPSSTPFHKPSPSSCNLPAHLCASRCHHCRTCTSGRSWPCPNTLGTASSRKLRPLLDSNERFTPTSNWQHVDLSKTSRISQIALPVGPFPRNIEFCIESEAISVPPDHDIPPLTQGAIQLR
jgi:hypothetical protein